MSFKFNDQPTIPATKGMREAISESLINTRQSVPLGLGGDFINNLCKDINNARAYLIAHGYSPNPKSSGDWIRSNLV